MAKSSTNEIVKILNRIQGHDNYTVIRDFFEISAIAVRNNVDYGKERDSYEQRYLSIVKKYRKEDLEVFVEALAVFMCWIQKAMDGDIPFRDFAGEIYMASGTSSDKAGQFFTPYHVSHLMAECNFDKDKLKAEIAADPDHVITIAEPTCGAGGLIVAAIDVLKDAGINYAWNAFVDCGDIDDRCVHMTYLTLSLLGSLPLCAVAMRWPLTTPKRGTRPRISSRGRTSRADCVAENTRQPQRCRKPSKSRRRPRNPCPSRSRKSRRLNPCPCRSRTKTGNFHFLTC